MDMDLRANFREVEKGLSDAAQREVAKATADGITATLQEIQRNTVKRMRRVIDRPTPFTLRAFHVRRAWARTLRGSIFAKDIQAEYLQWLETGGAQTPKGSAIPVPGRSQPLNQFGNLRRGALKRGFANTAKFFSGEPRNGAVKANQPGLWQRMGPKGRTRLRLVAVWADAARYTGRPLQFLDGARKTAAARIEANVLTRVMARLRRR